MSASIETPVSNVYGLVLSGGASRRMQHDKALIDYHGEPQLLWTYRLLASVLPRVFISVRADQCDEPVRRELPQIVDAFEDAGPAAGILSAQKLYPDVAWLVLACDLPRLDAATLQRLLQARDPEREATAFISSHDGLPEPLCALWEPASHAKLLERVKAGRSCPRKALIQGDTQLLEPHAADALDNINTPEELAILRAGHITSPTVMTSVTVEYYAQLREQAGLGRETVSSTADSLTALYAELRQRHGFRLDTAQLKVAVNAQFRDWQQPFAEGDVIVFIPPVAGG